MPTPSTPTQLSSAPVLSAPTAPYVVCKFGGTSVATREGRSALIAHVRKHLEAGKRPIIVVSALGRRPAPYATDSLLELIVDLPQDLRESDKLAATGEIIAAILTAAELRAAGIKAAAFTGAEAGIITDDTPANARITHVCPAALIHATETGVTPVVCGFQGISTNGYTTTLGRGGSDTTACALGVALGAQSVEIYSDVDGVMTADPRVVTDACVIDTLTPDELFQLARMGSRIVHQPAAELALASGAALLVKNTFTQHAGTRICDFEVYRNSQIATAIASKPGIVRFRVALVDEFDGTDTATGVEKAEGHDHDTLEESVHIQRQSVLYTALAQAGVSLDMFTPTVNFLYFTVDASDADRVCGELNTLALTYQCEEQLAKVTVVGAGMHGVPGVMARIASALAGHGIDIKQTADSHATISVLVAENKADEAVCALHAAFDLSDNPQEIVTTAVGGD